LEKEGAVVHDLPSRWIVSIKGTPIG
jgi:hypothetical protein